MISFSIKHCIGFLLVGSLFGTRAALAAISDICVNTTLTLGENGDVAAAVPSGSCTVDVTQSKSCTFDFSTVSSNFENVCTSSGGNFYEEDITWACKVTLAGQSYSVTYSYKNYPACIGGNCTDAEAMEFYQTSVFPAYESVLASQGFVCDVSGESGSFRSALSAALVIVSVTTTVAAFM